MRIALLGGTGDIGRGLAVRWLRDTDHEVVVGSRDPEKAREHAERYEAALHDHSIEASINGFENGMATDRADVAIACVPAYHLVDTVEAVADKLDDTILVSPAVGMQRDEAGLHYNRPGAGSVTALAVGAAPDDVPVIGAFHTLAAGRLADLDADLGWDTLIVGDDPDAKERVKTLADGIEGLRAVDAGGLDNAAEVESVTPLLVNVAANTDNLHDLGVRFE